MKYMLDTNICIYLIKKKPPQVLARLTSHKITEVCVSAITVGELEYGVAKSKYPERNKLALLQFLAPLSILPFDAKAALVFGDIRSRLELKGHPIGPYDTLIAAHARAENLILVSNNISEFARVLDLKVENWV
ncbi:type II toxin-antitoxin system VapC family toxin [candidate division KSB1 bacterium]|nr:type II toxin-antitoxin system VapC family toxin [candidate division KSB1 bacterium]RQW02728.1 MAG: type II toxin-antitoxin system VapC family toxin [candidate division KSB1 bacterium]